MSDSTPLLVWLYVFSGPHLGARVELGEGHWVLGSDDASDLILAGLESRHAVLHVASSDQTGTAAVTITPLDGPVRSQAGETLLPAEEGHATELAPKAGEAWYLGLTCLAWNFPDVTQPVILPEAERPDAESGTAADRVQADATAGSDDVGTADSQDAMAVQTGNSFGVAQPPLSEILPELPAGRSQQGFSFRKVLLLLLTAGALTAMSVAFSPRLVDERDYPEIIKQYLHDANIKGLAVSLRSPGVEVRGAVEDDAAMLRLRDMARALHIPVYLEVSVRDDVMRAVRSSLGIRGFHPRVAMEDTDDGVSRLKISAYMKDELFEKAAFTALSDEVKRLPPLDVQIVYERQLAPLLEEALNQAGLSAIRVIYLPGQVDFSGNIQPGDMDKLDAIRTSIGERLGIDLYGASHSATAMDARYPLSVEASRASSGWEQSDNPAAATAEAGNPLGGLRVTGVTMSPMKFVTTADGRRLFEGAVLPGGWILESISTRELMLRRGKQIVSHRLRGN